MTRLFDALLDDLAGEITRRDAAFVDLFPPQWPAISDVPDLLPAALRDPSDHERVLDLVETGIAAFEQRGFGGRRGGGGDRLGSVIVRGIVDAALADEGLSALMPAPRDERPLSDVLDADYAPGTTPSGRRYWIGRAPGRRLLVVNALGIPLEYWRPLLVDRDIGLAPIVTETRCGDIHDGGMACDVALDVHADDLIAILETIGGAPVDVLAWCNGARIAIDLADRRPDLVRSLVLLSPSLRNGEGAGSEFENLLHKIFDTARTSPALAAPLTRMLGQFLRVKDWDRTATETKRARQFLGLPDAAQARGLMAPMASANALLNYAARTASDEAYAIRAAAARLAMPVLLVTGDSDGVVDNDHTRRILAAAPALRHAEIAGAGHYIQHLQYPWLRALVSAFVADPAAPAMGVAARMSVAGALPPAVPEWWYRARAPGRRGTRYPLAHLFAWPAAARPLAPAIADPEVRLNFGQLERGARHLAARLRALGVTRGDPVLVLAEKRACMAIVAAGIWKALAVYVPVDASNPAARLANIVAQVKPVVVIGAAARLDGAGPAISFEEVLAGCNRAEPACTGPSEAVGDDDPAYILFTSGSTGSPKGVTISHRSLTDYFYNHNQVLRFGPGSRVLSLAPFHFDISIEDTLLPLSVGAFVYQFNGIPIGALMRQVLAREGITHLIAVSTLLALITEDGTQVTAAQLPDLVMVMTGAEECDPRLIDLWVDRLPHARVINAYGPTEATIVCMTQTIARPDRTRTTAYPIGRPLPGVTAMLVDAEGRRITAPDVRGELLVGGSQVMLGYLGMPVETAEAFAAIDGRRFYRTGDSCHVDATGAFVFDGRLDDMIKVAGRRIHLGEIRHAAMALGDLQRAVVGLCTRDGHDHIALVAVARFETAIGAQAAGDLRRGLAAMLPDYMVPRIIGVAAEAVATGNGKSDDDALLSLLAVAASREPSRSDFRLEADGGFAAVPHAERTAA